MLVSATLLNTQKRGSEDAPLQVLLSSAFGKGSYGLLVLSFQDEHCSSNDTNNALPALFPFLDLRVLGLNDEIPDLVNECRFVGRGDISG